MTIFPQMPSSPISIKPPSVKWSTSATIGLVASFGSYAGTAEVLTKDIGITCIALAATMLTLSLLTNNKIKQAIPLVACACFFLGRSATENNQENPPWAEVLNGDLVQLELTATSYPITKKKTTGEMSIFDYRKTTTTFKATASPPGVRSTIEISVVCKGNIKITIGEKIVLLGWLQKHSHSKNEFVCYTTNRSIKKTPKEIHKIDMARESIQQNLLVHLKGEQKTLASALFFGTRDRGWEKISKTFRHAGMSHILAISGMHVAIVIMFVCLVLKKLPLFRSLLILIIILFALFLLNIVEPRAPVTRAVIMIVVFMALKITRIRCNSISLLSVAAVIILLNKPNDAGSIGFQLSFIVVASILILVPQIVWRVLGPDDVDAPTEVMARRWMFSMLATGLCAWAIATPISTHTFGSMSPVGVVSNIPAVFMLVITLFFGIIKIVLSYTSGYTLEITSTLFETVLSKFIGMATMFGKIPLAHISGIYTSWLWSLLTISMIFIATLPIKNKRKSIAITTTAMVVWCAVHNTNDNNTTITTISVGHGTCHIIQNGEEVTMIDAGSRNNLDIGEKKIVPELRRLGVTKIKSLVITHSDIDHICGIIDIIQELTVNKVIIAKQTALHKTKPLLLVVEELNNKGIPVLEKNSGWSEAVGSAKITMLSPHIHDNHNSSNASSIVLLLESNGRGVLFTGDIDEQIISLLSPTLPKNIDVIELPHHGQWSQESHDLIYKNKPPVVIQSTNISRHTKDKWNLPPKTTRFVTATDGTITVIIDPGGTMAVSGSLLPDTMPTCLFHN